MKQSNQKAKHRRTSSTLALKNKNDKGRPEVMTEDMCIIFTTLQACKLDIIQICQILGICRQTYYNALDKGKLNQYFDEEQIIKLRHAIAKKFLNLKR